MSTFLPIIEIEFTAGVWTNVSADTDLAGGIPIHFGRTSEFSAPSVATCEIKLANPLGKYTPKSQLLTDGTAHPYYPNIVPRKRLRIRNASGTRFLGYIKSWAPLMENGFRSYVTVSAACRLDQLSRLNFKSMWEHEVAATSPLVSYLMNDAAGPTPMATTFADTGPNAVGPLVRAGGLTNFTTGASNPLPISDGLVGVGPGTDQGTNADAQAISPALTIDPDSFAFAGWLTVPVGSNTSAATGPALWLQLTDYGSANTSSSQFTQIALIAGNGTAPAGEYLLTCEAKASGARVGNVLTALPPSDGLPHHLAVVLSVSAGVQTMKMFVDGVLADSTTFTSGQFASRPPAYLLTTMNDSGFTGQVAGGINVWSGASSIAALPAQLLSLRSAGLGNPGETTGARAARLMGYLGISSSDYLIDTGKATLSGLQPLKNVAATNAFQALADTEGGGASFYTLPDGRLRFADRTFRKPTAAILTSLDSAADLTIDVQPTLDDLTLVNQSAVTRAGGNVMTDTDAVSLAANGLFNDSVTSYADTDVDALHLAQQRVSAQSTPSMRFPKFTVDLFTAQSGASITAACANLQIGSRVGVMNLPATMAPNGSLAVFVEGWTETISKTAWTLQFDASPVDNPARAVWDDTAYGRWQASGITLTSSITAGATSLSMTTAAGMPTFTQVSARYPMAIKIGEEVMLITAAPASGTSPQTVTVARGISSTPAAQTAGSAINLSPAACWAL